MKIDGKIEQGKCVRHRVQVFKRPGLNLLGQYGETGVAGRFIEKLNHPTVISANAGRCAVFDRDNYRIVKMEMGGAQ